MDLKYIKIGETYLLPFEVLKINDTDIHMRNGGVKGIFQPEELTEISHESAPKYDPCRKFRKGDKVRFKEYLGRRSLAHTDEYITLDSDEQHGQCFWTGVSATGDIWPRNAYFCYLELVEPVEELEPYSVVDAHTHWDVAGKDMKTVVTYSKAYHPHAKAAAAAECARLNAEHRKEQNHDSK